MTAAFLETVYRAGVECTTRQQCKLIFSQINTWLCEGRFSEVDNTLATLDVEQLNIDQMLAFLTITNAAADELKEREGYRHKVWHAICQAQGSEVADDLAERL